MRRGKNQLHVIRTDVLLWALEGLAERQQCCEHTSRLLTGRQIKAIRELAAKPRCAKGETIEMAERAGMRHGSLQQLVYRARRGYSPAYWKDAA